MATYHFLYIIEKAKHNYSAYVPDLVTYLSLRVEISQSLRSCSAKPTLSKRYATPDLPGCVTTGKTIDEIRKNIQEAIALHLEGMIKDGEPIPPQPQTLAEYTDVSVLASVA